ncbi:MAG: fumarylacetoacetate hydrolase family protein [Prevotella sp.]|nr:fumarylacetoacetate hydrolase family protein [Prevotella sp.]
MKIFGLAKNYFPAEAEARKAFQAPAEPIVFLKPNTAYLHNHKPFFVPQFMGRIDFETEVVVRICRLGKGIAERFARRYYDALTVGIDFTAHDYLVNAQQNGLPWDLCKGFDGAAVVGEWVAAERLENPDNLHFRLDINGRTVQTGCTADMIFSIDRMISYISRFYTLRTGDLIYTGTPAGSGSVSIGDRLEGWLEGEQLLSFNCK